MGCTSRCTPEGLDRLDGPNMAPKIRLGNATKTRLRLGFGMWERC